jgi:hypothetical protein
MNQSILPVGVAVHTRGNQHGEDYGWYLKVGSLSVFEKLKEIHRAMLCDRHDDFSQLAMVVQAKRVGFLLANLPGPREDHVYRVIYDTLYLEFDQPDHVKVFKTMASMLVASQPEKTQYIDYFTDYAEKIYAQYKHLIQTTSVSLKDLTGVKLTIREDSTYLKAISLSINSVKLPYQDYKQYLQAVTLPINNYFECSEENLETLKQAKWLLPFNDASCQQGARFLWALANGTVSSFCFIVTASINLERCQAVVEMAKGCIILVQSAEVVQPVNLSRGKLSNWLSKLTKKIQQK